MIYFSLLRKSALGFTLLCIFSLLLSSCATSHLTAVTKVKPEEAYVNLMVVYVDRAPEMAELNEDTYDKTIRNRFNALSNIKVRKQLEKTIANNVGTHATLVNRASDYFGVGEDIDYNTFISRIKETGAQGIMIINQNANWNRATYTTYSVGKRDPIQYTDTDLAPNASFLCYLIDLKSNKPVWVGQSNVLGTTWDGYDSLNNSLARSIAGKLTKAGFIYTSVSDIKMETEK